MKSLNWAFMLIGRRFILFGMCIGLVIFIQFEIFLTIVAKFILSLWQRWQSSSFALIRFINNISVSFVLPSDFNSVKIELYIVDISNWVRI